MDFAKIENSIRIIAQNPRIGRERSEITPPARIHPSGYHMIVYRIEDDGHILTIRLRHSRENWQAAPIGTDINNPINRCIPGLGTP